MRKRGLLIALVVLACALALAKLAAAAVTVTPASGGTNISADNAANAITPAWTTLGDIVIAEGNTGDMPASQTNVTLILTAPTNWQFNSAAGSVSFQNGRDITAASVAVAASTITVTFTTDNNANRSDTITISGIQVRPTDGSVALPSSGNILRTAGNPGTASITGITNGTTNFGSLSMAAGAARLAITSVNGGTNPTAGTAFSVVVRKQDQFGHLINAVANTGVSLSLNTGTGTLGGTLTGTITAGSSSTTINGVTYTKAESGVVLTATRTSGDTPVLAGNSAGFTVNPGALNNFLVEAAGGGAIGTQTAGTSFNIRVTARDANGNTVTSFTGAGNTVNITSTGTLSAGSGTTATFTSGVLASHAVTISNTGSFTITATRTSGGAENGTSNSFTVNPGALSSFLVEAAGGGSIGTQTAGTSFNVRITARDANGNTVTGFTGAGNTVDITSTGTLSAGSGTTATFTNGVLASHAVTISNTGIFTITATRTSGGAQSGTSNSFTVDPGALALFLVEQAGGGSIGPQTAGSSFNIRITARDSNGNTVTGFTGTVDISSTGTLSAGSGTTAAFTAGVLSSHAVTISNTGSFTVTATRTTGGAQTGTSNSFTVSPGALNDFLVEAAGGGSIGTQTAGSSFNVRITARDANGNTVTGFTGAGNTVDVTSTGTLSAGSGTTATFTSGVLASHAVTISNTGSFTIAATRTSGGAQTGTSNSFTVNPGALSNFLVEAAGGGSIGTQTAGSSFNVRITAQDASGNTVTTYSGAGNTVDISSTGTLSAGSGTTATFTNGVLASHAVTISNTGSFTITATRTSGGAQTGTSNSFTVNPGALSDFLVEAAGGGAIGTQTAGSSFNVRITARDANGNTVTSFNGAGNTVDVTSTGTLSAGSGATAAFTNGVLASHALTISNTGGFTITATRTSGGAQTGTSNSFSVNAGALDNFLVEAAGGGSIGTQTAGSSFNVRITARDANNNTVTGYTGTVDISSTGTLSAGSGTTAAFTNGVLASHAVTISNTGSFTITATRTSGGAQNGTSNSFVVDPGALANFLVEAAGGGAIGAQTAGSSFNVRITARDANNNTVTGYAGTVDITSTGTLSAGSGTTAAFTAGVLASHAVTISNTGSFTLTATRTSGGAQNGTSNSFTVNPGALANFLVEAAGGGAIATQTAGSSFNVRITARDANNNTVTGFTGTVDMTSTGTLWAGGGTTVAFTAGVLSSHAVTISDTGSFTLTATRTTGGAQTGTSNSFVVDPGALDNFLVEAAGGGSIGAQTAGSSFNVRITARDANNNTVTGFTGTVDITSTGTLSAGSGTTAAFTAGVLSSHAVTISNTGSFTITATRTSGGAQTGTSNSFTVNPGALSNFHVEAAGGGAIGAQTAGTSFNVRITARDANDNTVTGYTGTVDITSTGTLSAGSGTTAAFTSGVLSSHPVTISDTGSFTITATRTSGGAQNGTSNSFTVNPGALTDFLVEAAGGGSIGTQTAGSSFNLRITARDANANTVTGFTGTVDITSTGTLSAGSGTSAAFTAGVLSSHAVTISNTGSFTITATRTSGGAQNGTSNSFTVNPGAASKLAVTVVPATAAVGTAFSVTVRSTDANGNFANVSGATGISLSPSGAGSLGGSTATISAGTNNVTLPTVTYDTAETITLTAARTSGDALATSAASSGIDVKARPTTAITFPASGAAYNTSGWSAGCAPAGLCGSATDNSGTGLANVQLSIRRDTGNYWDGSGFNSASEQFVTASLAGSSWSYAFGAGSFPADGDYTIRVRATDNLGGVQSPLTSRTFTYDATTPDTSITAQPSDPTNATGAGFSFTSSEGGSSFECRLDGGSWTACTSPKSYTGLGDGSHAFDVRATDGAGNTDASPASFTWTVDTAAPNTSITAQPSDPTNAADADFSFSSSEGGSTFECRLDGGSWAACTSPKSYTGLADGPHTFDVRASDAAGNTDASPASFTWTVDTAAPNTSITAQPSDPTNATGAGFSFTSTEGGSTFECNLDSGGWSACASPKSYTGLADGPHTFQARATDAAGNTDATPATFTWTVDTAAPNTSITASPSDPTNATGASFSFTATETSTYECRLDAGAWAACTSPESYTGLGDGSHTFEVRATDAAGNTDGSPASFAWTVDTARPNTSITASPSDPTSATGASFTFTSSEGGSSFECRLDGGAWTACTSPTSYTGLSDALHTFEVRATDTAGNTDATPATFTWTVDTAAPNTSITAQPNDPASSADPDVSFASNEGGSTFECRLDGASWTACTSPESYTGLADGSHTFDVRATDTAGNTEASPASFTWTIDTVAPDTSITAQPSDPSGSADASFSFSATQGGSTFECRIDGAAWGACTSPKTSTGLADGPHTFDVRATDPAGNTDATPASFGWTIDTTAPNTSITAQPGDPTNATGASFSFSSTEGGSTFDCNLDSGAWGACASPKSYTGLADGPHTFQVRATDGAGNTDASPASFTWTVDTVAPDTQIDSAPTSPTNSQNADFDFSAPGGSSFDCRIDGGAWAPCTSPTSYAGLAEGSHTFDVRASDAAGNTDATPASRTWTIDLTAPTSDFTFPAAGGSYNAVGWSNPAGTAFDAVGLDRVEVSLRIAGGNWWSGTDFSATSESWQTASGTGSWSLAFAASGFPADGGYVLRVRAVDTSGNVGAATSRSFDVDTVAPETTIDTAPATPISDADADFAFSADQPGSSFECRLDGGAWAACTSPRSYTSLGEGPHTFDVRATDVGGNTDASPASHSWVIDTVPPAATMDDPGAYLRGTIALSANATDTGGTGIASVAFERSPAGASTWTGIPSSWDTTGTANGLYDLRVVATDLAGNSSSSPALSGRWVDNLKPTVSVDDPGAVTGTFAVTVTATDAHSGLGTVELQVLDGAWQSVGTDSGAPYEFTWDTTTLPDGPRDLRAIATDHAGNVETSATVTVIVDNTDPTVSFTAPTEGGFLNASSADPFTLVASAADTGSGVKEVEFFDGSTSLGVDTSAPYQASWTLPGADGPVTLTAIARDNAGRETSVDVGFVVDRALPDTTLGGNPGDPSREPAPVFGFTSNELGSTFECRFDAGAWAACASPLTSAPLADGPHTFEVRAIDAAGNVDPTPASWTWLLDATAPNASMTDPGANLRGDITLTSTQSDPGASPSGIASVEYEYSVADANTWVSVGPQPWHTNAVTDGLYDLRVVVTDNAGNRTESAPVEDRRIDNSPPATALDDPGANLRATVTLKGSAADTGSGVAQVEFEYSVDGSSWSPLAGGVDNSDPYEFAFDTTSLADGFYFFRTKATDVAGNTAWSAGVGPRRIDNTPPIAILNDPGANLRGTVSLTSTADDPGGSGVASVVYHYTGPETGTTSAAWTTSDVADGVYDLTVEVTDVAGNVTMSSVVAGRRVDNTAPTTGHNAPGGWQSSAVTVSLSPNDGGSGVANTQYAVDGGGWNSGTSVNVSGDGVHTISFFSTDVAGNVESAQTATVSIDTTPPDPGALDPGNYLRGTVTLNANPTNDPGGADLAEVEFQRKLSSDSTWTSMGVDTTDPYSASWATTPADDGTWDFRFIARDTATPANESITVLSSKIVDNTAPTGSVSSPLTGAVVSGSVTLGVTASDANPIASVEYFVDGGSVGSSSGTPFQVSWSSGSTGDGSHSISAVITDMAGNSTSTGGVGVTVDNFAPTVSVSGLPANVSGSVSVSASASGDTATVAYEARLLPSGGWSAIGSSSGGSPWQIAWSPGVDGTYEVRAKATDAGGNSGTSAVVTTRVDNTDPSGLLTAPGDGATVGGTVNLAANASDAGSGVATVTWQAQSGGGGFAAVASDSSAPYDAAWSVGGLPSGAYDLRIVVTDLAGNSFTSAPITVDVDATAPGVTLNNPGSPVSGTISLSASTTGDATSVTFSRSPAGAATWTAIGTDGSAPYAASFNTTTVGDGLYDLRAVVTDAVGNTSQSVVGAIRVDNFIPIVVSSMPANGSIVASASQIAITASEDIAALTGVTLDGAATAAPTISGATATFNTGALANGTHTLSGTVRDAAGNTSAFSITFMVGVPAPPPDPGTGGGTFGSVLPLVPAPLDFRGVLESDGSLTLRWTPSQNAKGQPYATILFVDGIAKQTFAPGEDDVNLGAFDPNDARVFSIAAVDADGHGSATSQKLRSTSNLSGKTLEEATAILRDRGFELGTVRGAGTVVSEPAMAPLGSKIDLELGQGQARFTFTVVGTKRWAPTQRRTIAIRVRTSSPAVVTANLLAPRNVRVGGWRFTLRAGTTIKRLTMPKVRRPGKYRVTFSVRSGPDSSRKTIVVQVLGKRPVRDNRPVDVVLTGASTEIARGIGNGTRVVPAVGEDTWTIAGSQDRNVQVIVVDVDRYGLQLVRDLHTVFPSLKLVALTNDPRRLAQAVRAGAAVAVPRSTPPADVAKLIRRLTRR